MAVKILTISTGKCSNISLSNSFQEEEKTILSAIAKTPVSSIDNQVVIRCDLEGLQGDEHADLSVHGGQAKAIYCYPVEHYDYWRNAIEASEIHLSRLDQHGALGENLTIEGIVEDQAFVGDVWKIGDVELEVTAPREPCFKFNAIMGDRLAGKKMFSQGLCGWYFSVRNPGRLKAGESIEIISGPRKRSIAGVFESLAKKNG